MGRRAGCRRVIAPSARARARALTTFAHDHLTAASGTLIGPSGGREVAREGSKNVRRLIRRILYFPRVRARPCLALEKSDKSPRRGEINCRGKLSANREKRIMSFSRRNARGFCTTVGEAFSRGMNNRDVSFPRQGFTGARSKTRRHLFDPPPSLSLSLLQASRPGR